MRYRFMPIASGETMRDGRATPYCEMRIDGQAPGETSWRRLGIWRVELRPAADAAAGAELSFLATDREEAVRALMLLEWPPP